MQQKENADGERRTGAGGERLTGVSDGARDPGRYRYDAEEHRDVCLARAPDCQERPAFRGG